MKRYEDKDFNELMTELIRFAELKEEYGSKGIPVILDDMKRILKEKTELLKSLPVDEEKKRNEPDEYNEILALRPQGIRVMTDRLPKDYDDRLKGAFLTRAAGCTLGAVVENWSISKMEGFARKLDVPFPPADYWPDVMDNPDTVRYIRGTMKDFMRSHMNGVPVDDDISYVLTGLLILEKYGFDFTTFDVASIWEQYVPMAYTAERIALEYIWDGLSPLISGEDHNPYAQWIGAAIRSDAFAYACPGQPEKAAMMAYKDAYLSHRRNGIYGEMFFAAAQSAAFCTDSSLEAIAIGLTEIPKKCELAEAVRWALSSCSQFKDYHEARKAVDERFKGMSTVHTINNACLVVFGLALGQDDPDRVISQTVALGMDNDCTAATAGSITGAVNGVSKLDSRWVIPFKNKINSYLNGIESFEIDDVLLRFKKLAMKYYNEKEPLK